MQAPDLLSFNAFSWPMDDGCVGWFCGYTPIEIVSAAGLKPTRLFGIDGSTDHADALLHSNICPYVRSCLESAKSRNPEALIFTNSCDGLLRLHDAWKHYFPPRYSFLLGVPHNAEALAKQSYRDSLLKLARSLENHTGNSITPESLTESFHLWEDVRRALRSVLSSRERGELHISGTQVLRVFISSQVLEPERFIEGARALLSDPPRVKPDDSPSKKILLLGNLLRPDGLPRLIEECGGEITIFDLCCGERFAAEPDRGHETVPPGHDLDEILLHLASYYLDRSPCPRMADREKRFELLGKRIAEVSPSGVIYAPLMFCDSFFYEYPLLKKHLSQTGVPILLLESDYRDENMGQLRTRVEAFLEMI